MFAHNGNILGFSDRRPASPSAARRVRGKRGAGPISVREFLAARCLPHYLRFVLGETDSELLFFLFLSHLERKASSLNLQGGIHSPKITLEIMTEALLAMIDDVEDAVGDSFCRDSTQPGRDNTFISVIVTNGKILLAHQGGQKLFYSTYKNKCVDRDVCASYGETCEAPSRTGAVNHFIVSSEPLQGENVWTEIPPGAVVGVDERMRLRLLKWEDMINLRAEDRQEVVVRPHKAPVDRVKYGVGGCGSTGLREQDRMGSDCDIEVTLPTTAPACLNPPLPSPPPLVDADSANLLEEHVQKSETNALSMVDSANTLPQVTPPTSSGSLNGFNSMGPWKVSHTPPAGRVRRPSPLTPDATESEGDSGDNLHPPPIPELPPPHTLRTIRQRRSSRLLVDEGIGLGGELVNRVDKLGALAPEVKRAVGVEERGELQW
ncbi:hypothetical protein HDU93_003024 [Gonapodya sp. JEL0774]|nr:hypothetical protein HDU93_003024 [Gonapodya sp. JEL0774]